LKETVKLQEKSKNMHNIKQKHVCGGELGVASRSEDLEVLCSEVMISKAVHATLLKAERTSTVF